MEVINSVSRNQSGFTKVYPYTWSESDEAGDRGQEKKSFKTEGLVYQAMKIFHITITIWGITLPPHFKTSKCENFHWKKITASLWITVTHLWMILLSARYVGVLIRLNSIHDNGDGGLQASLSISGLLALIWCAQSSYKALFMVYIAKKSSKLSKFYRIWQENTSNYLTSSLNLEIDPKRIRVYAIVASSVASFTIISKTILFTVGITQIEFDGQLNDTSLEVFEAFFFPFKISNVNKSSLLLSLSEVMFHAAGILPVCYFATLIYTLSKQFDAFNQGFSKLVKEGKLTVNLKDLRIQHHRLCEVVREAEGIFSPFLGVNILLDIFSACFILYQLIFSTSYYGQISTLYLVWLIPTIIEIGTFLWFPSILHNRAHSIGNQLQGIQELERKDEIQMTMFLSKLNGESVSLTLWGFVSITKELIITITGVYITYFALIVQTI